MSATTKNSIRYKCKYSGLSTADLDKQCSRARTLNYFEDRKLQNTIFKLSKKHQRAVDIIKRETFELKYFLRQNPPPPQPSPSLASEDGDNNFAGRRMSLSAGAVLNGARKPTFPSIVKGPKPPRSAPTDDGNIRRTSVLVKTPDSPKASSAVAPSRRYSMQINVKYLEGLAAKAIQSQKFEDESDSYESDDKSQEKEDITTPLKPTVGGPMTLAQRRMSFLTKLEDARKRRIELQVNNSSDEEDENCDVFSEDVKGALGVRREPSRRMSHVIPPATKTYDFVSRRMSLHIPPQLNQISQNGTKKKTVRINENHELDENKKRRPSIVESFGFGNMRGGGRQGRQGFSHYGLEEDENIKGKVIVPKPRYSITSVADSDDSDDSAYKGRRRSSISRKKRRSSVNQGNMSRKDSVPRTPPSTIYLLEKRLETMKRRLSTAQPASFAELAKVELTPEGSKEITWPNKETEVAELMLENEMDEKEILQRKVRVFLERIRKVPSPHPRLRMSKAEYDNRQFKLAMRQLEIN